VAASLVVVAPACAGHALVDVLDGSTLEATEPHTAVTPDRALDLLLGRPRDRVHPVRPNSPRGRNASTSAIRMKVKIGEYCPQQSEDVTGR